MNTTGTWKCDPRVIELGAAFRHCLTGKRAAAIRYPEELKVEVVKFPL